MFRFLMTLIVLVAGMLTAQCFAESSVLPEYRRLIIFGDSYSDNGNVFKITQEIVPNADRYYQGRFTNGLTWGEYFAAYFNISPEDPQRFLDFAYGGAKIKSAVNETIYGSPKKHYTVPNLAQQINSYIKNYEVFNEDDLVVIFMGTNDFTSLFRKNPRSYFQALADQESAQIDLLLQKNARHIIVFKVRNLTYSPVLEWVKQKLVFPVTWVADKNSNYLQHSINIFNRRLAANLVNKPEVFLYDTYQFDDKIFAEIKKSGFSYKMDNRQYLLQHDLPCYQNYSGNYQRNSGVVCKNSQAYFFYDRIHTTFAVNYLLAEDVYRQFHSRQIDSSGK